MFLLFFCSRAIWQCILLFEMTLAGFLVSHTHTHTSNPFPDLKYIDRSPPSLSSSSLFLFTSAYLTHSICIYIHSESLDFIFKINLSIYSNSWKQLTEICAIFDDGQWYVSKWVFMFVGWLLQEYNLTHLETLWVKPAHRNWNCPLIYVFNDIHTPAS